MLYLFLADFNLEIKEKKLPEQKTYSQNIALFVAAALASYALLKKGNYKAALIFYPKAGGGGVNFYKKKPDGKLHRMFAVDYHPFKDPKTQQNQWRFHYHRGKNSSQMNKHRPYQGGW
ncbi:hypothetical protein Lmor_0329 [Legionella moravica]|uniref:Uncharacterized protein n=1 Tax=Legionella moravica TaxID=39962 RepID=A0A378K046_9GAMM|nr:MULTISPECIES: hypothetical protein [Legionella]KTD38324.1 hypothetical protein Lmor_0329 [Legionella moravica]RUR19088.1 hypothetical protein ELY21_06070 [Legionella sp. km535]STX63677.1 Uncharacterised protein [Legionella moravica]